VDLDPDPVDEAFRAEVRAGLASILPGQPLPSVNTEEGFAAHREFERKLADARLAVVSWPERYGGRDAPLSQWLVFEEEYYRAGGPVRVGQNGLFLLAPTLFAHGSEEQLDRILPPMATAEQVWAQAWSEPGAGSDLAAIRSSAVSTEEGWLLSGQKTWSSRAAFADRAFGLFRSDPAAERHRGLTYLMFDLRAPGVTVRPIAQLDGEPGFAEIFLDEVFVPDADVIGEPGAGWKVAMSTASHERGLSLRSPGRFMAATDRLVRLWQSGSDRPREGRQAHGERIAPEAPQANRAIAGREAIGDRVADAWIAARAYQLHTHGTVASLADGGTLGAESSLGKVFWSELDVSLCETALDLLGPHAELADRYWADSYLFALAGPIYAGTNEIQRSVIAERLLGLPR
jgi:alkylation response protein AidB-like acyl-CoA dehydrogenase